MISNPNTKPTDKQITDLVPADVGTLFPGAVLVDDTPLWMAWEMARDEWLQTLRAENTRQSYSSDLRLFFEWAKVDPWDVSIGLATRYKNHLDAQKRADSTINRKLAALSSFYEFVRRRFVFHRAGVDVSLWPSDRANPFDAVQRYQLEPFGRSKFPTTDELRAILAEINTDCLEGTRDFALLYTYAVTCRRCSEILNLKYGDLTFQDDGDVAFDYIYKGGKHKKAIIPRLAWAAIAAYLRADGRPHEQMQPGDYIFVPLYPERAARLPQHDAGGDPNRPISASTASEILKKYGRRAGIAPEKCHLHALRHAGARLRLDQMRERGQIDLMEICNLLGHSSLAVTQIYLESAHTDPEDPGGNDAASALLPIKHRRKRKPPPPEQLTLEEAQ